tara:strand:+ start:492 stop:641 length:150 start_codon:yes stop_codon:yes gene_type:complete
VKADGDYRPFHLAEPIPSNNLISILHQEQIILQQCSFSGCGKGLKSRNP